MEQSIPEEYYNSREQEVINFYKQYYTPDKDTDLFYEKYLLTLKTVQELASQDSSTKAARTQKFSLSLDQLLSFRTKEQVGEELVESAMKELFQMIDIMLRAVQAHKISGGIHAMNIVLRKYNHREYEDKMLNRVFEYLFNQEYESLPEILEYIRAYVKKHSLSVFETYQGRIYEFINGLWVKNDNRIEEEEPQNSIEQYSEYPLFRRGLLKIVPDIHLAIESLYKTLLVFIEEMPENSLLIHTQLLELIYQTKRHPRQEVRALGCDILGVIIPKISNNVWTEHLNSIGNFIIELMGDEMTLVRYKATRNVFKFINKAVESNSLTQFSASITPKILMNRYHPDQALKQETKTLWKLFLDKAGMTKQFNEFLSKLTNESCEFYLSQLNYQNADILQAACLTLKELINKIKGSAETIKAHFQEILNSCLRILEHENPSVRATSFPVLESLIVKFPDLSRGRLSELINAGFFQISLNYKKEESAELIATFLVTIYKTFTQDVQQLYAEKIKEKLLCSERSEDIIQVREEVKPLVQKGKLIRPKGFEVATGALILLSELMIVQKEFFDANLEILNNIVNLKNAQYHDSMMCYAWRVLNKGLELSDVKVIKPECELIIEALFRDVNNTNQNVSVEVSQTIKTLSQKLGAGFFKQRVEGAFGNKYAKDLEKALKP